MTDGQKPPRSQPAYESRRSAPRAALLRQPLAHDQAEVELTRFGGHLDTRGDQPKLEDVPDGTDLYQAVSARVPG
jgi:hypothetical protein